METDEEEYFYVCNSDPWVHSWPGTWRSAKIPFVEGTFDMGLAKTDAFAFYSTNVMLQLTGWVMRGLITKFSAMVTHDPHREITVNGSADSVTGEKTTYEFKGTFRQDHPKHPNWERIVGTYRCDLDCGTFSSNYSEIPNFNNRNSMGDDDGLVVVETTPKTHPKPRIPKEFYHKSNMRKPAPRQNKTKRSKTKKSVR